MDFKEIIKGIPSWLIGLGLLSIAGLLIVSWSTGRTFTLFDSEVGVKPPVSAGGSSKLPKGTIISWYSKDGELPKGWAVCDGTKGTPDLRGRFLMGGGGFADVGNKGGISIIEATSTGEHSLTIAEMPKHNHVQTLSGGVGGEVGYTHVASQKWGEANIAGGKSTLYKGSGKSHSHSIPGHDNRPDYYTVLFIMKL